MILEEDLSFGCQIQKNLIDDEKISINENKSYVKNNYKIKNIMNKLVKYEKKFLLKMSDKNEYEVSGK